MSSRSTPIVAGREGFHVADDGVWFYDESHNPVQVCGKLSILAETRDVDGENWGRYLEWSDNNRKVQRWAMPMSMLAGDGIEMRQRLISGGLFIPPNKQAKELLSRFIQTFRAPRRVLCVNQVGWNQNVFVLPDRSVSANAGDEGGVLFQSAECMESLYACIGSLEGWQQHISRRCSGNSRLLLAVSAAFAGPLLQLADAESGGIHLVGPSADGKTTTLVVASSVIGRRSVRSWRATDNALEAVAALHNDNTLLLDELAQFDAAKASEIAYGLFNGKGKERMNKAIALQRTLRWRLLCLSSGEVTLAEHASTANKRLRAGSEVRLINLPSSGGAGMGVFENLHGINGPASFADELKQACGQHSGHALRAFLQQLVGKRERAREVLADLRKRFRDDYVPDGASNEIGRGADRFAIIAAGGELATEWGVTQWQRGEPTEATKRCFYDWLAFRGGPHSADVQATVTRIWTLIARFGASRFQPVGNSNLRVADRLGFVRTIENRTEYLILPAVFREEICSGVDYKAVARFLDQQGKLRRQLPHWTIRTTLPELGKGQVYCIIPGEPDAL